MTIEHNSPIDETAPAARCPVLHEVPAAMGSLANQHWWPEQLNLRPLNKNSPLIDPMGDSFDYAEEFNSLDLAALKADIAEAITTSQDWWPADYGHYGPLMIRMAWHSAGTYRIHDGRGGGGSGTHRFAPLNSWPDNANLDKARRVLWPVKQKYGRKISWADLMILAGNVALESMGFETFGFGGGRTDVWEPEEDIYWGPETGWLDDERYSGDRELADPLGAVQMGLIYVNPEGPNGQPDPLAAARDIRETFARMAMDDTETVALIAGGHTFGKTHGAADGDQYAGPEPEGASLEEQGLGWTSTFGSGMAGDAITSGLEGAWTPTPVTWDNTFFETLFGYDWELSKSPAGAWQWVPTDPAASGTVPDPHDPSKRHTPVMLTTDLSLRMDPVYEPISRRFLAEPRRVRRRLRQGVVQACPSRYGAGGPVSGSGGPRRAADLAGIPYPPSTMSWSTTPTLLLSRPGSSTPGSLLPGWSRPPGLRRRRSATATCAAVPTAPASGSPPRSTGRPTTPLSCRPCWRPSNQVQAEFNSSQSGAKRVSLADLIVLGGCAAVEEAARNAGCDVAVPFSPGRTDASLEQTDVESFAVLEPTADGFRNYWRAGDKRRPETVLVGPGEPAVVDGAGDDGSHPRSSCPGRQLSRIGAGLCSPTAPGP